MIGAPGVSLIVVGELEASAGLETHGDQALVDSQISIFLRGIAEGFLFSALLHQRVEKRLVFLVCHRVSPENKAVAPAPATGQVGIFAVHPTREEPRGRDIALVFVQLIQLW